MIGVIDPSRMAESDKDEPEIGAKRRTIYTKYNDQYR